MPKHREPIAGAHKESIERALEKCEARFRRVVESATNAMVMVRANGQIEMVNTQAELVFGYSRTELLGQPVEMLVPERFRKHHPGLRNSFFGDPLPHPVGAGRDLYGLKKDGSEFPIEIGLNPIETEEGTMVLSSIVDISTRKRLEEQLRQSQKMKAIGQLTGGIAHDFNNLLTVILGNADTLAELLEDEGFRRLAIMTRTAAQRGAELTNRLLTFASRQTLEPKLVDVNRLITEMDGLLRRTLSENIEIAFQCDSNLWTVSIDPGELENAVLNLCLNARDAMSAGGQLTIETANKNLDQAHANSADEVAAGEYVMIAVSDSGCGMSPETVAKAFDPFFTTKEIGRGTGLGLSMVYGFIKQSRGHARIYSELGHGTTIKLYLPRVLGEGNTQTVSEHKAAVRSGTETILVVEDNDLVRAHATLLLESLGYKVVAAGNGREALKILERGDTHFDLLFTDMVMPGGIDGPQLAEQAARIWPDLPVLFTSGYTENAIVHHGRSDPGVQLLNKPYKRDALAAKIRSVLGIAK